MIHGRVWTVFRKELRETLRDRRTLLVMVVVPVFLYPALMVILFQLALFGQQQLRKDPVAVAVTGAGERARTFLERDSALQILPPQLASTEALRRGEIDAVVEFAEPGAGLHGSASVRVLYDASRDRSLRAESELSERLGAWGDTLLAERLTAQGLPVTFTAPLVVADSSVATAERVGARALGQFLPVLLLVMTLLGAFFPAIDLTAGEKERATLETLLTTPLPNREIITGKFMAVVTLAVAAAALNLGSMLLTFQSGIFRLSEASDLQFSLPPAVVGVVLVGLIPLAVFFAALFMGIAVRAQSFKEAQNSLAPVQFASMVPMYLPLIPGIPLSYAVAVIPIGGIAVLFRELMVGSAPVGPSIVAVLATMAYAALALRFAARAFGREEVLFGSGTGAAEPLPLSERVRRWRTAARGVPGPAESLLFVGIVALLYFYLGAPLQSGDIRRGLLASQWLLLALPVLLFVAAGRYRPRATLALNPPSPRSLAAAVLVVLGGIPIGWLLTWLQMPVVEVPEEFMAAFQELLTADSTAELLWLLAVIALTPAICEELVFRGVLLQGFSSQMTMGRAVLGSALIFGAFHLSTETFIRFLPTAWLGALLGYVAWRTRSIFPSMLMHFLNNAAVLLLVALGGMEGYLVGPEGEPRWVAVAGGAVLLGIGLRLLPRREEGAPAEPVPARVASPEPASVSNR